MGGSSGALIEVLLRTMARAVGAGADWCSAFKEGVDAVAFVGGAKRGYRTMLDALLPAVDV